MALTTGRALWVTLVALGVATHHLRAAAPNANPPRAVPALCDVKADVEQQYAVTGRVKS